MNNDELSLTEALRIFWKPKKSSTAMGKKEDDNEEAESFSSDDEEDKEEAEKCIKHYSSSQRILLVGEGDFSFSLSLAKAFGSAHNMVATSLDTQGIISNSVNKRLRSLMEVLIFIFLLDVVNMIREFRQEVR